MKMRRETDPIVAAQMVMFADLEARDRRIRTEVEGRYAQVLASTEDQLGDPPQLPYVGRDAGVFDAQPNQPRIGTGAHGAHIELASRAVSMCYTNGPLVD